MIDKSYFSNANAKNIVHDYTPRDISSYSLDNSSNPNLENMILNSNLDNENLVK